GRIYTITKSPQKRFLLIYGDGLSDEERLQLIEYLKTL
ncbi:MAG: hypothetical protein ACI8YQ_003904, partial [Polaribacter sp.]